MPFLTSLFTENKNTQYCFDFKILCLILKRFCVVMQWGGSIIPVLKAGLLGFLMVHVFPIYGGEPGKNPGFMYVNLKQENLISLPESTTLNPLCDEKDTQNSCFSQWVNLARPLSQETGGKKALHFYLPTLHDLKPLPENSPSLDQNWMPIYGFEGHTRYYQKVNSDEVREITGKGEAARIRHGKLLYVSEEDIDVAPSSEGGGGLVVKTMTPSAIGIKGTMSRTKEILEGCVVIDKVQSGFCFDCDTPNNIKQVETEIKDLLQKVNTKRRRNISGKGIRDSKICHPNTSLRNVIRNFNNTCRPEQFNKFFEKIYCDSCQNGVPPEVMLAMMTVESSGKCGSVNRSRVENSVGLFQINSRQHNCTSRHRRRSKANWNCLMKPVNNLRKSLSILKNFFRKVNDTSQTKLVSSCETNWTQLSPQTRDAYRKAMSAYNGGNIWIDRAVQVVENIRNLNNSKLGKYNRDAIQGVAKLSDANWEQLRVYYFVEKLNSRHGRAPKNTISNLAYTEAILGREASGSPRGVVEHWVQYIRKNKPKKCE